jgi:hypothetical protein
MRIESKISMAFITFYEACKINKSSSSLLIVGKAMIRFRQIPYLLCASVSLWLDSVTVGIIIASISNKTTEAQRHRDNIATASPTPYIEEPQIFAAMH